MEEDKLWKEIEQQRTMQYDQMALMKEIASVVWGDSVTRNNGLRSIVNGLVVEVRELREDLADTWNNKRPAECIGKHELEAFKLEIKEQKTEENAMTKARLDFKSAILVAVIAAAASIPSTILAIMNFLQNGGKP